MVGGDLDVLDGEVSSVTVLVNRAFFFFIRDVATNTVLLVEREGAPTAP